MPDTDKSQETEVSYIRFNEQQIIAMNAMRDLIGDWQDKKKWTEEPEWRAVLRGMIETAATTLLPEEKAALETLAAQPFPGRSPLELQMLMVTEIAEMTEGSRAKVMPMDDHCPTLTTDEAELADYFVRGFSYAAERKIDIGKALAIKHAYNCRRPERHGKKF